MRIYSLRLLQCHAELVCKVYAQESFNLPLFFQIVNDRHRKLHVTVEDMHTILCSLLIHIIIVQFMETHWWILKDGGRLKKYNNTIYK